MKLPAATVAANQRRVFAKRGSGKWLGADFANLASDCRKRGDAGLAYGLAGSDGGAAKVAMRRIQQIQKWIRQGFVQFREKYFSR